MRKLKWFIGWSLLYSFSLFWVFLLFNKINLNNEVIILLIAGLIISFFSKIYKLILNKEHFKISWFILYSTLINSFSLWLSIVVIRGINFNIFPINLFLSGFIFEIIWRLNHKIPKTRTNRIVFITFLVVILLVTHYYILEQRVSISDEMSNFNTINIFNGFSGFGLFYKDEKCPQIDIPISRDNLNIQPQTFKDTKIFCYSYREALFGYSTSCSVIPCYKGIEKTNNKGLNKYHYYCGDLEDVKNLAGLEKTLVNPDGTIGETIKRTFMNEYDSNLNYVRTFCGGNPDDIIRNYVQKQEEEAKRQLKSLVGDIKDIFGG